MRVLSALVVCGLGVLAAGRADAACTVSTTGVSFGTYDVFSTTAVTSTGSVIYRCAASDHDVQITISQGTSGTFSARTLIKGTESLSYNLFLDAAMTSVWGDGSGSTGAYTRHNPQNDRDVTVTVYGRISAQQDVSVGSYADTVVVTINF
jgi:spore coat protein U-like protein